MSRNWFSKIHRCGGLLWVGYYAQIKCTKCGEIHPNEIYFNLVETQKIEGSKGSANFIAKVILSLISSVNFVNRKIQSRCWINSTKATLRTTQVNLWPSLNWSAGRRDCTVEDGSQLRLSRKMDSEYSEKLILCGRMLTCQRESGLSTMTRL